MLSGLIALLEGTEHVKKLSDCELSTTVIEKVWGQLVLGSEQDFLLDELISRFEEKCGIERDDEGRVVAPEPTHE